MPVLGTPELDDVTVEEAYAFVTGGAAGDGLYIFDISDEGNPFRVSSEFSLGAGARSPVVYRDRLYLITDNGGDDDNSSGSFKKPSIYDSIKPQSRINNPTEKIDSDTGEISKITADVQSAKLKQLLGQIKQT